MYPPVFEIAVAAAPVTGLLGTDPCRLYPFGRAPQNVTYPYAVWQVVGGSPENFLGTPPDADSYRVQIDVYGRSAASVRAIAEALRDAYETRAYVVRWGGETTEPVTELVRFSFDVDFIIQR